jgi:hypothetical protein
MLTKTLGTIFIVIVCIMVVPLGIGIIGGVFGIVVGVVGAVFGALFGIIGSIFGALFGVFDWAFDDFFGWNNFEFFDCNVFTLGIIAVVIAIAIKSRNEKGSRTR